MNAPRADRVAVIATELGHLGRRLDALAAELSTWQVGPPSEHPEFGGDRADPVGTRCVHGHTLADSY